MTAPRKRPAKRRASGPSGKHLGLGVTIRAEDAAELARWDAAAKAAELPRAQWLRRIANEAADR